MLKKEFDTSYVGFKEDGAKWLVENTGIKLIGEIEIITNYKLLFSLNDFLYITDLFIIDKPIIGVEYDSIEFCKKILRIDMCLSFTKRKSSHKRIHKIGNVMRKIYNGSS